MRKKPSFTGEGRFIYSVHYGGKTGIRPGDAVQVCLFHVATMAVDCLVRGGGIR
jgi:hypothetical protein